MRDVDSLLIIQRLELLASASVEILARCCPHEHAPFVGRVHTCAPGWSTPIAQTAFRPSPSQAAYGQAAYEWLSLSSMLCVTCG